MVMVSGQVDHEFRNTDTLYKYIVRIWIPIDCQICSEINVCKLRNYMNANKLIKLLL